MTENEVLNGVRDYAVGQFDSVLESVGAVRIDSSEYAFPVSVNDEVRWAKVKFSAAKAGFDGDANAVEFAEVLSHREAKAKADAEKRAAKASEKLAKLQAKLEA